MAKKTMKVAKEPKKKMNKEQRFYLATLEKVQTDLKRKQNLLKKEETVLSRIQNRVDFLKKGIAAAQELENTLTKLAGFETPGYIPPDYGSWGSLRANPFPITVPAIPHPPVYVPNSGKIGDGSWPVTRPTLICNHSFNDMADNGMVRTFVPDTVTVGSTYVADPNDQVSFTGSEPEVLASPTDTVGDLP